MHWWIAVWLAASPAWGEYPRPEHAELQPEPPDGSPERRAELDAMQAALGEWARERKEASRERERSRELRSELEALQGQGDDATLPEVERGPSTRGGKHAEPKVIEITPEPTHEQAEGWLEQEVARRKAAAQSRPETSQPRKDEDAQTDATARDLQHALDQARQGESRPTQPRRVMPDASPAGAADAGVPSQPPESTPTTQ